MPAAAPCRGLSRHTSISVALVGYMFSYPRFHFFVLFWSRRSAVLPRSMFCCATNNQPCLCRTTTLLVSVDESTECIFVCAPSSATEVLLLLVLLKYFSF
ncbi:unnamed protein product [Discosporangium mesarthrocarpum]